MKRNLLLFFVIVFSAVLLTVSANATVPEDEGVMPCWENMSSINLSIGFSEDVGTATVSVSRIAGITTSIEATLEVYRKSGSRWVFVDDVSGSSTRSLGLDLDFDAVEGTQYKAVAYVTAYGPNGAESETVTETATP